MLRRADVNHGLLTPQIERSLAGAAFAVVPIAEIAVLLQYGCSLRATDAPTGVPIVRMANLQAEGWRLDELKYVELTPGRLAAWRLEPGDIVFNRTNSKELVGKCEVFREAGVWVFASYLLRLRVDRARVEPQFVCDFLATRAGRLQIDRASRQILGMSNINAEEVRALRLPLPEPATQRRLVAELDEARQERMRKLRQAEELLAGTDAQVLERLGLVLPADASGMCFVVERARARDEGRLNAEFFHPERMSALAAIRARYGGRSAKLSEIGRFRRDQRGVRPEDEYLGLAHVQAHTGERVVDPEEVGEGICFEFRAGDVLYARLRPYLNKVVLAERPGVCSTEFHVIRVGRDDVLPAYLAAVLRSRVVLAQTRHMMTGNTHPRLAHEDVAGLVIPIPDHEVQRGIAEEVALRREQARSARAEARRIWDEATRRFERALIGPGGAEN